MYYCYVIDYSYIVVMENEINIKPLKCVKKIATKVMCTCILMQKHFFRIQKNRSTVILHTTF